MSERVIVRTGNAFRQYTTVDPTPIPESALDEHGHLWSFDGGASDIDAPYTCLLCSMPQWRAYNEPCANAGQLPELNAERSAWIEKNRVTEVPLRTDGFDIEWALAKVG